MDLPARPLAVTGCQQECSWGPTGDRLAGDTLFACAACGSEWVRSEEWTPIDWQGEVPEAVVAEREAQAAEVGALEDPSHR